MMPNNSRMLCSSSTTSTRVSATDRGKAEGEDAAGARRRLHVNLAAVLLHDPLHEGEAEPAAVEFRGEEGLEDVTEVLARDALSGVAHAHLEPVAHHLRRHPALAAVRHGLDGIETQVPHGLTKLLHVGHPLEAGRELAGDLQRAGRRAVLEQHQHLVDRLDDVHASPHQRRRPRVLEEGTQDLGEAPGFLEDVLREPLPHLAGRPAAREDLDGARERGEWIADLVRDVRRHAAERCEAISLAEALLHRPHRCEVFTRADHPELLILVAGARLNVVMVCDRSTAISPVPTDSNTRSLMARRSRNVRPWIWNRSASPPATMATTRKVPALANIVMISSAVVSCGASNSVRGSTVRPKTSPV